MVALSCSFVPAQSSDGYEYDCGANYLVEKGKLKSDFPIRQSALDTLGSLNCTIIALLAVRIYDEQVKTHLQKYIPDDVDCLIGELEYEETSDLLLKLEVIQASNLSESQKRTQKDETKSEIKQNLDEAALHCGTEEIKLAGSLNDFIGIKITTLSASEHMYCYGIFADVHNLLPLEGVNLNPNGIDIGHVNCCAIIAEQSKETEKDLLRKIYETSPKSVSCVLQAYKNGNLFNVRIGLLVLNYFEFSKETKVSEQSKFYDELGDFALKIVICARITQYFK